MLYEALVTHKLQLRKRGCGLISNIIFLFPNFNLCVKLLWVYLLKCREGVKPIMLLEAERGAGCADGRGDSITPQRLNSPLPCEERCLTLSLSWIHVSTCFAAHSASRRPITLCDTISFGPLGAPQCMALVRFQRQEDSRRQYSLEIYLEPTKRINAIDQR